MIDDRLNLWFPFIPETDSLLLYQPPPGLVEGMKKTKNNFVISSNLDEIKKDKKHEAICLWVSKSQNLSNKLLDYAKGYDTIVILPIDDIDKETEAKFIKEGRSIDKYFLLPGSGNPKWMIPDINNKKIVENSLDFYFPNQRIAKIKKSFTLFSIKSGLFKRFWKSEYIFIVTKKVSQSGVIPKLKKYYKVDEIFLSAASGTLSPYRKIALQVMNEMGGILGFVKVGISEGSKEQIGREANSLLELKSLNIQSAIVPDLLERWETNNLEYLLQSSPVGDFKSGHPKMKDPHRKFLFEIYNKTIDNFPFENYPPWLSLQDKVASINQKEYEDYRTFFDEILVKIESSLKNRELPSIRIHGDFAPWNTKISHNELFIFDWEYSKRNGLPYYDFIYWHIQVLTLLKRESPENILDQLLKDMGNFSYPNSDVLCEMEIKKVIILWSLLEIILFWKRLDRDFTENYMVTLIKICKMIVRSNFD